MKIVLLFLIFPLVGFSQIKTLNDTTYFDRDWKKCDKRFHYYYRIYERTDYLIGNDSLYKIYDYYKNGKIQMTGYLTSLSSDRRVGLYSYFNKKGKIEYSKLYNYKNTISIFSEIKNYSKLVGECDQDSIDFYVYYFSNGHVNKAGFYSTKKGFSGKWIVYNQFNNDIYEIMSFKDGKLHGKRELYYPNGQLWQENYFTNGQRVGIWSFFGMNGELKYQKVFKDDKFVEKRNSTHAYK